MHAKHLERLFPIRFLSRGCKDSNSVYLMASLGLCIYNKSLTDSYANGPRTWFEKFCCKQQSCWVFLLQKDVPRLSCPHYRKMDISCGQGMFWTMILSSNCMFESIGEVLWKYQYMEYIPKDFDWVGVGMEFWLPRPFNHPPLISLLPHPGLRPCYSKCISG